MKSKKNLGRVLSMLMALSMIAGTVPAFAASGSHTVDVLHDGSLRYRNSYKAGQRVALDLYTTGEKDIEAVTVTSGEYTSNVTVGDEAVTGTLTEGTVYTLSTEVAKDGTKTLKLATTAIQDSFSIDVTTKETGYTIVANSGAAGTNDNLGSANAPTCEVSEVEQKVKGGEGWSVTFKPYAGAEIKQINIRPNYSNQSNLFSADSLTAKVEGKVFNIDKDAKTGAVTVSCPAAYADMFVTALTGSVTEKFTLTVATDGNLTTDGGSEVLASGTSKDVTFTPSSGHYVDTVTITDGGKTATIGSNSTSVTVNGHTYSLNRKLDGSAVLSVPAIAATVAIMANSAEGRNYVVVRGDDVYSNYETLTYVGDTDSVTVTITPVDDAELTEIRIATGKGTVTIDPEDDSFVLGGTVYRVSHRYSDTVTIYLNPLPGNVEITAYTKNTKHTITASTDNGAEVSGDKRIYVRDGEDEKVIFRAVDDWKIDTITVTRNGRTYTADVDDKYINVNGVKFTISKMASGKVSVTLREVDADMTVKATTNYTSTGLVVKKSGSHSTITTDPTNVKYGDNVTITVKPSSGYELSSVTITYNGKTTTIREDDDSFTLGGKSFKVRHRSNGNWIITANNITKSLTINSKAVKDGYVDKDDWYDRNDEDFHQAYMVGVSYNMFAPEANMTRGEAVTMLSRLFSGLDDDELKDWDTESSFKDVAENKWYTPYIVWAEDAGLLDGLYGSKRYFRPEDNITRAEYVDLVYRFKEVNSNLNFNSPYSDINAGYWAFKQITYAANQGWITGYVDGTFKPDNTITRCEVVALTNRMLGRTTKSITVYGTSNRMTYFSDVPVDFWAYTAIMEATNDHYVRQVNHLGETWEY